MALPWSSSLDVSYVGTHNYNSDRVRFDLDAGGPDAARPERAGHRCGVSSAEPGSDARRRAPFPARGRADRSAASVSRPRRDRRDVGRGSTPTTTRCRCPTTAASATAGRAGLNWTLGLRYKGNTLSPQHCSTTLTARFGLRAIRRPTTRCCRTSASAGTSSRAISCGICLTSKRVEQRQRRCVARVANGWQLSGVFTGGSGSPYDATLLVSDRRREREPHGLAELHGAHHASTGDPDRAARAISTRSSTRRRSRGRRTAASGNESGINLLTGCLDHTMDLAIARNIRIGGPADAVPAGRVQRVQHRRDQRAAKPVQFNTPSDPTTIRNNQYNADGT